MRSDGTDVRRLTSEPSGALSPSWSPDGNKIAFVAFTPGSNRDIYTISPDGTGRQRVTSLPAHEEGPDWSPDGNKLAFSYATFNDHVLYTANADGSGVRNLGVPGDEPAWSPDGTKIAYRSREFPTPGALEIATVNADGTGKLHLNDNDPHPQREGDPSWQPTMRPPPRPTNKDECKKGGWQSYGVFKNQGDCVSFVATGGKNPPANGP